MIIKKAMVEGQTHKRISYLKNSIFDNVDSRGQKWLEEKLRSIEQSPHEKELYMSFSMAPRFMGKMRLKASTGAPSELLPKVDISRYTVDQATRIVLLLQYADQRLLSEKVTDTLFQTAEVNELVALYNALPWLPNPEKFIKRAEEGIRSNIITVFEAIALHNPYPELHLSENAWNQMILKAIFTERILDHIEGLDKRANKALAHMLQDFAHERWAAGRNVTPELWRPMVNFLNEESFLADIEVLLEKGSTLEQKAAVLALSESSHAQGKVLLSSFQGKRESVKQEITWKIIAEEWQQNKI